MEGIIFIVCCVLSWQDCKYKRVSGRIIFSFMTGLIIFEIMTSQSTILAAFFEILMNTSMGLLLSGIGVMWKEKIGIADGLVCILVGMALGIVKGTQVMFIAFLLVFFYGIIKIFFFHGDKKESLAFIPFITISYGIVWMVL